MALCPECENPLDFDEEDVEEGEVILCDECGNEFEVITVEPLELAPVEEGYDDEEEETVAEATDDEE
jgi:alpha-aminoadipate carrier protein LysW